MESNSSVTLDQQLFKFCQEAAVIYHSKEFKKLYKEIAKLYQKNGIRNFKRVAFQDSLFSLYMEQHDGEMSSQAL